MEKAKKIYDKKTILLIVVFLLITITGIVLLFVFGQDFINSRNSEFSLGDGYIISSTSSDNGEIISTRQYFSANTPYRTDYSGDVEFSNTSGEVTHVPQDSFVHYLDNTIGIFTKSAILDLDSLRKKDDVITYYNLSPPSHLRYISGNYVAELHGQRTNFRSVIIKISENKFLVAAPEISIEIGDTKNRIRNSYLEVTYFDGDIIRLENQELTYQNIAKNTDLFIGDVHLDLRNKVISKDDTVITELGLITIDSDDNIALTGYSGEPSEEASSDESEVASDTDTSSTSDTSSKTANSSDSSSPSSSSSNEEAEGTRGLLDDLTSGIIEVETEEEGEINEYERLHDPTFVISSFELTANSLDAAIEVEDKDSVLTGDTRIEIANVASGESVYQDRLTNGETYFEISTENLEPETNYALIVTAGYVKDNSEYDRTFVQKTFITESVGISLEENYVSTDTISLAITRSEQYSKVSELTVALYDATGAEVGSRNIDFSTGNSAEVSFYNLSPNTTYIARLEDFHYKNAIVANNFSISESLTTLKRKPSLSLPSYTVNKRDSIFTIGVSDLKDLDNSVVSYRYEFFDARDPRSVELNSPVYAVDSERSTIEVSVENGFLERDTPYNVRVVAVFNDNIFEHEYTTALAGPMSMNGKAFPTLRFDEDEVTFEKINGTIIISDDAHTVDINSPITVIYNNSVGVTESFTASGSYEIPFIKNNLRKDESYVISIYGKVDLDDNNPAIDNCFIGSLIIQTQDTNSFNLNSAVDGSDSSNAFLIRAQLEQGGDGETELEADTLSGLTFNIYDGKDTSGRLIRSALKIDDNEDAYTSNLRADYYDKAFEITPALFGMSNRALSSQIESGYATIEVTDAYDYTRYKNSIGISNNTVIVKINASAPDLPIQTDDAIEVIPIRNADAGEHFDSALGNDTIVGYSIRADFNNSAHSLREINYTLHAEDGTAIHNYSTDVSASQTNLGYTDIYFDGYGTEFNTKDTDFRRGNTYYLTYRAKIDVTNTGTLEDWPSDSTILRSKSFSPDKQAPAFRSFPVDSDTNTFHWKYSLKDLDHAITSKLTYTSNGILIDSLDIPESPDSYSQLNFSGLSTGPFTAYYRAATLKNASDIDIVVPINLDFESNSSYALPIYEVSLRDNSAIFTFTNYNSSLIFDHIASSRLELSTSNRTITIDSPRINNDGAIVVNLSNVAELVGQEITPRFIFEYDSGIAGFELEGERVALKRQNSNNYEYLSLVNGQLISGVDAMNSLFTYSLTENTFSPAHNQYTLSLTSEKNSENISLPTYIAEGGMKHNDQYLILKQIASAEVAPSSSSSFRFDSAIPGVSLENEYGERTISPATTSAEVSGEVYGAINQNIKDNILYLNVYKTSSSGVQSELVQEGLVVPIINNSTFSYTINNLESGTNYYIKIYADAKSTSDTYERVQLYDVDANDTIAYYFKTIAPVSFNNIEVSYRSESQDQRYIRLAYDLETITGYDYINYEVYRTESDGTDIEKIDLEIHDDTVASVHTTKDIAIPSGSGVSTGKYYKIYLVAYRDGNRISTASSEPYYFSQLYSPKTRIASSRTDVDTIAFSVRIFDRSYVIVGGSYTIEILDRNGQDITPEAYKDETFLADGITKRFRLEGIGNSEYTFNVKYQYDVQNNAPSSYVQHTQTYRISIGENDFSAGNISMTSDSSNHAKIRLIFYNSNKLTTATKIRYYIYSSDSFGWSSESDFISTQVSDSGDIYYYYTIPDVILSEPGVYYAQLQFLNDDGTVLSDEAVEYLYAK